MRIAAIFVNVGASSTMLYNIILAIVQYIYIIIMRYAYRQITVLVCLLFDQTILQCDHSFLFQTFVHSIVARVITTFVMNAFGFDIYIKCIYNS